VSSDLLLMISGVLIFSLTTVATLWFGYSRFFEWYEQSPDGPVPSTSSATSAAPAPAASAGL